jgi:hypothetical protein
MRSDRSTSWLARIEHILTAKTHDLRKLAALADLDPRTMYIGTRLDGADLRGQDLRDMAFTHLDPAKVRTDARTQLDRIATPAQGVLPGVPLVLFYDRALEEGYHRQPSRIPFAIAAFSFDQAEAFWRACESHDGPKLILGLAGFGAPLRPYRPGRPEPADVIHVLGVESRGVQFMRGVEVVIDQLTAPTVLVPLPLDFGELRSSALSASFCDLVALATVEWSLLRDLAHSSHVSLFISARPETTDDLESAWFALCSRIWKLGLVNSFGYRLGAQNDGRAGELSQLLFPTLEPHSIREIARWPGARAMVFLNEPHERGFLDDDAYSEIVVSLLEAQGWSEVGVNAPNDFHFEGDHLGLSIDVRYRNRTERLPSRDGFMPISAVRGLCVSEDADAGAILWMLNEEHQLLVNLQDLRWLDAGTSSLWQVVAHQARRIARASHSRSRTLYFVALMRSAIELGRAHDIGDDFGQPVANDSGRVEPMRIVTVEFEKGRIVFRVTIRPPARPDAGFKTFLLGVDAGGPFIEAA